MRIRPLVGVVAVMATLFVSTSAAAGTAADTQVNFRLQGDTTASTHLTFDRTVVLRPLFERGTCTKPRWIDDFVGLEITGGRSSSFAYLGMVWCDATSQSVTLTAGEWSEGGGGYATTSKDGIPKFIRTESVRLAPGNYQFTLLTKHPTSVWLGGRKPSQRTIRVNGSAASDEHAAMFGSGQPTQSTLRTLPLQIPGGSHLAVLMYLHRWTGSWAAEAGGACLDQATPCVPAPPSVVLIPAWATQTRGGVDLSATFVVSPSAGATTARFYSTQSGLTTHQELLALALP